MAPDGFDMSVCTLAAVSSDLFGRFSLPLQRDLVLTVLLTIMHILIILAVCGLIFVYPGLALALIAAYGPHRQRI